MSYYKIVNDGYVISCGSFAKQYSGDKAEVITETEYMILWSAFLKKPKRTDTTDYRLREDLTWEEYEVEPPDTDPDIDDAEALQIILGGEAE